MVKADPNDKMEEAMYNLSKRIEASEDDAPMGITPLKKRPKLEIRSLALEAGFELTLMDLEEDLVTTPDLVVSNIRREWQKAGQNFQTQKELESKEPETQFEAS
jgi:hypothetical protein